MSINLDIQRIHEGSFLRGFSNMMRKENRDWWGTRRWWINLLVWIGILNVVLALVLFVLPPMAQIANPDLIDTYGGQKELAMKLGYTVFFEFGTLAMAIGAIILSQDLILDEKQSGVIEWLLAKPVSRRSYILSKVLANAIAILILMVLIPGVIGYILFSLVQGSMLPAGLYWSAIGIMAVHTLFYVTLTIMLGTFFNNRAGILAISMASLLGGTIIGGFIQVSFYITPWMLSKSASNVASGQGFLLTQKLTSLPTAVSFIWCLIFIILAIWKFQKTEF